MKGIVASRESNSAPRHGTIAHAGHPLSVAVIERLASSPAADSAWWAPRCPIVSQYAKRILH